MNKFYVIWIAQLLSIASTGVTNFSLGLWVLQDSDSVFTYSTLLILAALPGIVLAPFIGALVDRFSRKAIIITADLIAASTTVGLIYLNSINLLSVEYVYLATVIDSIALSFQIPAIIAAVTMIVPKEKLGQTAGLNEVSLAFSALCGPLLSSVLSDFMGITGILIIDLVTFVFACCLISTVQIPNPQKSQNETKSHSMVSDIKQGFEFIVKRKNLTYLLMYCAFINLIYGMTMALTLPVALEISNEKTAGFILSCGGVGALLGGIYMAITGGPDRKINGIYAGVFLATVSLFILGFLTNTWSMALALTLFYASLPIAFASEQIIWQHKVDPNMQGRVFAISTAISSIFIPAGSFLSGISAESLFSSQLTSAKFIAESLTPISMNHFVTTPLFIAIAIISLIAAYWAYQNKFIRDIETQLPDRTDDLLIHDGDTHLNQPA